MIGLAVATMLLVELLPLSLGFAAKLNRQVFERDLQPRLTSHQASLPHGTLQIVGRGIPGPTFREYEANFLLFRATGSTYWWTRIGPTVDPAFAVPEWLDRPGYDLGRIFTRTGSRCSTVVSIAAVGYDRLDHVARNALGLATGANVAIESTSSSCP